MVKDKVDQYHLSMQFNNKVFELDTSDLKSAILSVKPVFLKTKILFRITRGNEVCERQLFPQRGKLIFKGKGYLDLFINQLIFKPQ